MKNEQFESEKILKAAAAFAALGSEQRLQVLRSIVRAGPEGVSIGELGQRSGITGSTLTHHMNILRTAGLVEQSRQGRSIICVAAAYDEMQALSDFLLSECCADSPAGTHDKDHSHG
ncbi:MAG: ArsR/SmtB family transcription factor [Marinosulfonomonas sp.]